MPTVTECLKIARAVHFCLCWETASQKPLGDSHVPPQHVRPGTKLPLVLSSVLLIFLPHISATTHLIQVLTSLIEIPSRSLNDRTSVSFPSLALTQTISQNSFFTRVCTFCAGSCLGSDSEGSFQSDSLPFPRLWSQDPQAPGSGASDSTNTPAWCSPAISLKCLKNTWIQKILRAFYWQKKEKKGDK